MHRASTPNTSIQGAVIDCADPARLARFWATVLAARWGVPFDGWAVVEAEPILVCFQRVPEPKPPTKNRVHLDVVVEDLDVAAERAVTFGGRVRREPEFTGDSGFVVMVDPEGNEFCFVTDPSGSFMALMRGCLGNDGNPMSGS